MVAPNPAIRVSPSGPLADGQTNPFLEYAGLVMRGKNTGSDSEKIFNLTELGGVETGFLARLGQPQTGAPAGDLEDTAQSGDFGFDVGTWIVEADVQVGFQTDAPTALNNAAALQAQASFINDSNAVAVAQTAPQTAAPKPAGLTGGSFSEVRSSVFFFELVVTPAMITANNEQPLKGFQLQLTRLSGIDAQVGTYDANSGQLTIYNGTSVRIRRYR